MLQRIGFVTCVELGRSCIEEVHAMGGAFDLFVTLDDHLATNKSGRVYLDDLAENSGTALAKIRHINDPDSVEAIRQADLDWLFIIGWSQIASAEVLSVPKRGVLGMHPTLLPVGRGRAAIPWAILNGLTKTGVTLFVLDEGVDSGPIVDQEEVVMSRQETAATLYPRIVDAHRQLIRRVWLDLVSGKVMLHPQDESNATYWAGRRPEDGEINLGMTVEQVDRLVRATTRPYPGAFVNIGDKIYTVWAGKPSDNCHVREGISITCADGVYIGTEIELRKI